MGLLDWLFPSRKEKREWRQEEETWASTSSYPLVFVRTYRSERQLKRDARRVAKLGYSVRSRILERNRNWRWYVTYIRR